MNAELSPLTSFILPGGSEAAAWLHLARTVARRAERCMTALAAEQPVSPEAIKYINRLSDHLFVLARKLNDNGGVGRALGAGREPLIRNDCAASNALKELTKRFHPAILCSAP